MNNTHVETCGRCGRELTTKKAIADGYGRICKAKVDAEEAKETDRLKNAKENAADF